jgi:hypothetical protein
MNPHKKFKNHGPDGFMLILMMLGLCFIGFVAIIIDPLHKKNIEQPKYSKPPLLTCIYCKGTGERVEDVNRIMFLAKTQLYLNKHLTVDKCEKCVKMPETGSYIYCDEANHQYSVFLKEYGAAGPKMEMTSCGECMGMGTFTIMNKDGSYLTQEEYEAGEKEKIK